MSINLAGFAMCCPPYMSNSNVTFEIKFINDVLLDNDYSLRKSAETLGMHYSGLHRKMRHLGMPKTYRRTSK